MGFTFEPKSNQHGEIVRYLWTVNDEHNVKRKKQNPYGETREVKQKLKREQNQNKKKNGSSH